jgi:hypothetical protein
MGVALVRNANHEDAFPEFQGNALHLHVTGGIAASLTPWWINWLRAISPHVVVHVSVTPRAQRFVSLQALRAMANGSVWSDDWDADGLPHSWREGGAAGCDCILVFPASLDTVMRLAQGRAETPALMMLQITKLPVIVADVSPADNEVIEHWRRVLAKRPNVAFVPQIDTFRADSRYITKSGFNMPGAIMLANGMLSRD